MNEELIGTVVSVWYPPSTKASGSDFVIVTIYDRDGTQHKCKGEAKDGTFAPNLDYTFYGLWKDHPTHGMAFQFKQAIHREPLSRKGVFEYIVKYIPHVGPVTANALLRNYNPDEVIDVIKNDPERVCFQTSLSLEHAEQAAEVLKQMEVMQETQIRLVAIFAKRGFPATIYKWVIDKYGIGAIEIIKGDPFRLLVDHAPGAGFLRCDQMWLDFGHDPNDLRRQMYGLWAYFNADMVGHTWFPASGGASYLHDKLSSVDAVRPEEALKYGIEEGWLVSRNLDGKLYISSAQRAEDEATILNHLIVRMEKQNGT